MQYESNSTECGKITQTEIYVARSVKLTCMWQYQSNWPVCSFISQTDPFIAISVKLTRKCQYESNWPIYCNISQIGLHMVKSVKLIYMWQNPYLAISVKLTYILVWLILSHKGEFDWYCYMQVSLTDINTYWSAWLIKSNWPVCSSICQTDLYVTMSVKLIYMS